MSFARALIVIACICSIAFGYIKDTFQVLPVPKVVSFKDQSVARAVKLGNNPLSISDPKNVCTGECQKILKGAFDRSITQTMKAQVGLQPWLLSIHPEFSAAPVVKPSLPNPVTEINVLFTGLSPAVPPMLATNTTYEYYEIVVAETGALRIVTHTVWGALHALETVAQLFEWNGDEFVVQRLPILLKDEPRFPWRGFMVDCARHFQPFYKLRQIVDALVAFKMNVIHLHLSDAQSFPMEVPDLPGLAKSAMSPKAVYKTKDMIDFIEYARVRGVMVVPEADIPAHTGSWRYANSDITADCFSYLTSLSGVYEENIVALNPASDLTWKAIDSVVKHYSKTFSTSAYTHVGGDEVHTSCWEKATQAAAIKDFMKSHGLTSYQQLEVFFGNYAQNAATLSGKIPIVWEDSLLNGAATASSIIHVWRSHDALVKALRSGHYAITSYPYYLDRESPLCSGTCSGINWMFSWTYRDMYLNDPTAGLGLKPEEEARVLGGEAALWGESIDGINFDHMAFSRLGAFAERFWSLASVKEPKNFEARSQRHRCLNVKRGITPGAGSLYSDFCETATYFG